MSPSILRSAFIVTATAGAALLTSCNSTRTANSTQTATPPDVESPLPPSLSQPLVKRERSITVTPSKARPGSRAIEYSVIEISISDEDAKTHPLSRYFSAAAPQPPGRPATVTLPSLRELSQTRGVDLMNLGKAREGQTLRFNFTNPLPFPDEYLPNGEAKSWTTARTGVESTLRGELEENGTIINLRGSLSCKETAGFTKYRLPAGLEVLQPTFNRRAATFDTLRIPNGGCVIIAGPDRTEKQYIEDKHLGGLIRKKSTVTVSRYLAIGASSGPVPGSLTANTASTAKPSGG